MLLKKNKYKKLGLKVNIVLKVDQRSGKLTTGIVKIYLQIHLLIHME